ncbi:uncharacterized protein METZ01_LOCUS25597 [marine metagenome]|uniref:Uncharacterized protein n=1 Tax=marine metagenome TaxID=408172 RepID=A0A381Q539_9ZZZZ
MRSHDEVGYKRRAKARGDSKADASF